jgi:hypothetical protein
MNRFNIPCDAPLGIAPDPQDPHSLKCEGVYPDMAYVLTSQALVRKPLALPIDRLELIDKLRREFPDTQEILVVYPGTGTNIKIYKKR